MNKAAVIALACFIIGGLVGAALTYEFAGCKSSEVIFQLKQPS